jgi:uncharacterized membrane protein AbrB (regulator of aidB expression)
MTQEQMRLSIVALLTVTIAFGLYLGWHFTHTGHHQTACSNTSMFGCKP